MLVAEDADKALHFIITGEEELPEQSLSHVAGDDEAPKERKSML